jgi:hypothetical protein
MKLVPRYKLLIVATAGLAFTALSANAQLVNVNLNEEATFGPFVGGTNNSVTNNGTFNTTEVISTGTPSATPFTITYTALSGPQTFQLNNGTLNTGTFKFASPIQPLSYFTSVALVEDFDFDDNGTIDLVQDYTLDLTPFTAPNGLTGVNYTIVPVQFFGAVTFGGQTYSYASVVSNSVGTLFDGSSTTAALQFQFLSTPVPEPSTYALFGVLALGGIVLLKRRQSTSGGMSLSA